MPPPPEPEPEPPAMPMGLVDKLMQQHHTNADILYSLGRDPCKEYKLSKAPAVLARVRAGNKTCSMCSRVLASTQSLRSHIRSTHMDETCYKCHKCGKIFGDSYVLQVHLKKKNISLKGSHTNAGFVAKVLSQWTTETNIWKFIRKVCPMSVLWHNLHSHQVIGWP